MNDLSPEARALLELASGEDSPNREDRVRIRRALAASLTAGVVSSSATAAAASKSALGAASGAVAKSTIGIWLTVGVVAGLAGSAAIFVSTSKAPSTATAPQHEATRTKAPAPQQPPAPPATPEAPEAMPATAAVQVEAPQVAAKPQSLRAAPSASKAAPQIATSLAPETALLESARTALGRGDAPGALALLERHEHEFPAGVLLEERLAAKVLALCSLGRRDEAARAATRLLRLSPTSPLRARVLDSCAYEH